MKFWILFLLFIRGCVLIAQEVDGNLDENVSVGEHNMWFYIVGLVGVVLLQIFRRWLRNQKK